MWRVSSGSFSVHRPYQPSSLRPSHPLHRIRSLSNILARSIDLTIEVIDLTEEVEDDLTEEVENDLSIEVIDLTEEQDALPVEDSALPVEQSKELLYRETELKGSTVFAKSHFIVRITRITSFGT